MENPILVPTALRAKEFMPSEALLNYVMADYKRTELLDMRLAVPDGDSRSEILDQKIEACTDEQRAIATELYAHDRGDWAGLFNRLGIAILSNTTQSSWRQAEVTTPERAAAELVLHLTKIFDVANPNAVS